MAATISVVIPTYNLATYLPRAIDSVLAQTRAPDEIIVVDDGSTDDTPQTVRPYLDRIRFIRQQNAGASVARNTAIEAAKGEWIAFLDGDDELLPGHLKLLSDLLARNPALVWSTGNFLRCDCDHGHRQRLDLTGRRLEAAVALLGGRDCFDSYFAAHNAFAAGCTDTMLICREVLIEAGLFTPGLKRINDMDMWFRIAYRHPPIGFVREPVAVYHLDIPDSTIKAHTDGQIVSEFVERHLALAEQFGKRKDFEPCATKMVGWWIACLLRQKRGPEARHLLRQHWDLFGPYCRTTTYIRALFPRLGAAYEWGKIALRGKK